MRFQRLSTDTVGAINPAMGGNYEAVDGYDDDDDHRRKNDNFQSFEQPGGSNVIVTTN